jgi:hypothetical protein
LYTILEQRSQAWIGTLAAPMGARVRAMLDLATREGVPAVVIEGWRSPTRQDQLYREGRTRARGWESQHQWGLAVDIVPLDTQGRLWWQAPQSVWDRLGFFGETQGLRWGGRWTPPDRVHFEFPVSGLMMVMGSVMMVGLLIILSSTWKQSP